MTVNTGPAVVGVDDDQRWPRWRVWAIRIWYGLLSLWALAMSQAVVQLVLGRVDRGEWFAHAAVSAWKLLALGGVFVICWTGGRSVIAFHALLLGWIGWGGSALLYATQPAYDTTPVASMLATIVLWLLPVILLRPHRRQLLRVDARPSAVLLPLALAAAAPLVIYAVQQGRLAAPGNGFNDLRYSACTLGVVLAMQAVFAALRPGGSRWLPRFVALATGWIGVAATMWPGDVTSFGRAWGIASTIWALAFLTAGELEVRRTSVDGPPTNPLPQTGAAPARTASADH